MYKNIGLQITQHSGMKTTGADNFSFQADCRDLIHYANASAPLFSQYRQYETLSPHYRIAVHVFSLSRPVLVRLDQYRRMGCR